LTALDELVKAGTVRAIGASNFDAGMIEEADAFSRDNGLTRFTAIQNLYSLIKRRAEVDVLPLCERLDIAFIPYFPLAMGLLTGKYERNAPAPADGRLAGRDQIATDEEWDVVERLTKFAADHGVSLPSLAIGALLAQPAVASVIAGVSRPEQVRSNAEAAARIPDPQEMAELRALLA
jgi:aryl-alcohol dehydrogenase-like predicted oxidoreductase